MSAFSPSGLLYWLQHHHHPLLRALRLLIRSLPTLLAILIALGIYLSWLGIPAPLLRRLLRQAEETQGLSLEIDKVTLHPLRGLTARNLRYFGRTPRPFPLLQAERVSLIVRPRDLLRKQPVARGLRIHDATIRIDPTQPAFGAPAAAPLLVRNASARILFSANREFEVTDLRATLLNLSLRGRGTVRPAAPSLQPAQPPALGGPARVFRAFDQPPPWFDALIANLQRIDLEGEPDLDIDFLLVPGDWPQSTVRLQGSGGESKLRGVQIDSWELAADFRNNRIKVEPFTVYEGNNLFQLAGQYDLANRFVQGGVTSSLPASHWLSLMPIAWRDGLLERGFFLEGTVGCHASFGPAPFASLHQHTAGTLSVHRAEAFGVRVQDADLLFSHHEGELRLEEINAVIGAPQQRGTVRGSLLYDLNRHAFEGEAETKFDFLALLPLLSDEMAELIRNASITDEPAHASVRFRRTGPYEGAFSMQGFLRATNFLWRGSFVERLDTGLLYENRTTHLDPFLAERSDGQVEGSIVVDTAEKRVDLHLSSSIDPHAAGRGAGPTLQSILDRFRFDGPATARVDGVVYWGEIGETRLTATATAQQAGYSALVADQVDLTVLVSNKHVAVQDIHADIFDGTLQGWFTTDPQPDDLPGRTYELRAEVNNIDFRQLAVAFRQEEEERQSGRLSGRVNLLGVLDISHPDIATGTGSIRIRDGTLLRVRLFGGLSRQLSRFLPGLGFATQTDFRADFAIANRRVYSDSVVIEGPIINLSGEGSYGFDRSLDFDVRVRLLRDRAGLGRVIQLVTAPLFWLFEFDLKGTIDDPVWSARTLPLDLLGEREDPTP